MSRLTLRRSLIAVMIAAAASNVAYAADQTLPISGDLKNWRTFNASSKAPATAIYSHAKDGIDLVQGITVNATTDTGYQNYLVIPVSGSITYDDTTCVSNVCSIKALTLTQQSSFTGYYDVNSPFDQDPEYGAVDKKTDGFDTLDPNHVKGGGITVSGLKWTLNTAQAYMSQDNGFGTLVGCDVEEPQCSFTKVGVNTNDHSNNYAPGSGQSVFDFQGITNGLLTQPKSNVGLTGYGTAFKSWSAVPGVTGLTINISTGAVTLAVASQVSSGAPATNAANKAEFVLTALLSVDTDGDGDLDSADNCPNDPNADQLNTDGDAQGNVCDLNDDGDNWTDSEESTCGTDPLNAASQCTDTDSDGLSDASDLDDDNDGVADTSDAFPLNSAESVDTDSDGTGNNADTDDDNDGVSDTQEATNGTNPLVVDTDSDGDNDGADNCPVTSNGDQLNTDGDSQGNACDADDDNDGVTDTQEVTNGTNPLLVDTDSDGDNDGADNCPVTSNGDQLNTDGDSLGNACDSNDDNDADTDVQEANCGSDPLNASSSCADFVDTDGDTRFDSVDNCPLVVNLDQLNTDGDSQGNACDADDDNDGVADGSDIFPLDQAESVDTDSDGTGNNADTDDDNDGVSDTQEATNGTNPLLVDTDSDGDNDGADNCPLTSNGDQLNTDGDSQGNACDADDDNDGVTDTQEVTNGTNPLLVDTDSDGDNDGADNCPVTSNGDQLNTDGDSQGDACDADDDNDGVADGSDAFPFDSAESVDTDSDGTGNNADTDDDNDGVSDTQEATNGTNPLLVDTDSDGDNDGADNCPVTSNGDQLNTDGDSQGNACDADDDNDGVTDTQEATNGTNPLLVDTDSDGDNDDADNCPLTSNGDQLNTDGANDGGNACDTDDDNDGVADGSDAFPFDSAESVDTDGDTIGNNADLNDDGDADTDAQEAACGSNPLNASSDCSNTDADFDGKPDGTDNCPSLANADQLNTDGDSQGNACDTDDDNDGVLDSADIFPLDAAESKDKDGNGVGDNADKAAINSNINEANGALTNLKSQFVAEPSAVGKEAVLNTYIGFLNQADDATANANKAAADAALVSAQLAALQPSGSSKAELKTFKNQQKALKSQIKTILKSQKAAEKSAAKLVKSATKLAKKQKLSPGAVQLAEQIQNQSTLIDEKQAELAQLD